MSRVESDTESYCAFKYIAFLPTGLQGLSKQIDWTPRQIERWWRRRRLHGKPCEMQRFKETRYELTIVCYYVYV